MNKKLYVSAFKMKKITRQILIEKFYKASDFGLKKNNALDFE